MKHLTLEQITELPSRYRTTFMNSISGFKSLQMVATINKTNGATNIALFNSIFHIGANPPYIGMVVRPDGPEHETLKNISESSYYTLNNVKEEFYKAAHQTSARYKAGESEFAACGFQEEYLEGFDAPFVKESSVKLGLKLKEIIPVALNGTRIVIGEVQHILVDENLISADGYINLAATNTVTVAGLDAYHSTQLLARLSYAQPEKHPEEINV
ncbi:flavin reductase family protein [Pedobacter puniceum]|uniref:Flavin oxidoreductase n=1 Tax=Pedobacter puniceum TaxID=2666136 RepID=A0A7K0FQV1_9SPHI|nr:flavin reductase [Pedobacter puniceum]MRX47845.1 flavin oxidoreductase [Pedobacter puniceum]